LFKLPSWLRATPVPREKKFFVLFEQSAENAVKVAQQLRDMVCVWENVKERVVMIASSEQQGDAITHQVMSQLHRTFITPFDREDIALLAQSLDNVADSIHAAADAMWLYKVDRPSGRTKEMADILVEAASELEKAVSEIHGHINREHLLRHCVEVNRLENMGDGVYRLAMAELFTESTDVVYLIKWREIYDHMEDALDSCEDVANVLEGVALKYA
jgi:predicted phosphate transport protein (TIGR00153 family)